MCHTYHCKTLGGSVTCRFPTNRAVALIYIMFRTSSRLIFFKSVRLQSSTYLMNTHSNPGQWSKKELGMDIALPVQTQTMNTPITSIIRFRFEYLKLCRFKIRAKLGFYSHVKKEERRERKRGMLPNRATE